MNAAVVNAFDQPPQYATFTDPIPADGEQLVTVAAAGLHPIVKSLANGSHYGSTGELPFVPGVDGVGRLADGARVYFGSARSPYGTMAELSLASKAVCFPLPDGLDDTIAAGMANPGMSSWVALTARARFNAGESVLILGATGTAGRLAVQIAKRLGARRVVAAARNHDALESLRDLGADALVPLNQTPEEIVAAYRKELNESGVDVVLDYLWGNPAELLLQAIAQKGLHMSAPRIRYVQIGGSAGSAISLPAATLRSSGLELLGSGFGSASLEQIGEAIRQFFQAAVEKPFDFEVTLAPLREVQTLWNSADHDARLVFQP